ncbi:MAG: class I SAM-dependent methyltransferase [Candidatus Diapherotrites archaeon]|nr:class I SAM-dependent methyltransferase [Candidatus Diapherotrites archaeon]
MVLNRNIRRYLKKTFTKRRGQDAKRKRERVERLHSWYSGEHYIERVPFRTFVKEGEFHVDVLENELKKLVTNPENCTALEIGPGQNPVIPRLPFKRMVFLDRSFNLVKYLPGTKVPVQIPGERYPEALPLDFVAGKRAKYVVGDARKLPFGKTKFDVAMVAEVFTHVRPEERITALNEIMQRCNAFVLVDRPTQSLPELRKEIRERIGSIKLWNERVGEGIRIWLRIKNGSLDYERGISLLHGLELFNDFGKREYLAKKQDPEKHIVVLRELLEYNGNELRESYVPERTDLVRIQNELVDFGEITRFLKKHGWVVELKDADSQKIYKLLIAKHSS